MNKKILLTVQITTIILCSGILGGLYCFTDIYDDVQSTIVEVLCLNCIKLQPKTSREFTFETANGNPHPDFVISTLKTKGPILIQYGEKGCLPCFEMIENVIQPYFNLEFDKTKSYETEVEFKNSSFVFIYIYIDDDSTPVERKESDEIYDKDHIGGFPMFTIITIEYDHDGDVKPYYTSLYGKFEGDNWEQSYQVFAELLEFSIESYARNMAGYK